MNTPTLPELPKPDHWIEDEARRHGAHICYFNEQNVSKYGREGVWIMGYSHEQMHDYARAALSSALPQPDSGHQAQQPDSTPAATADSARIRWLHAPGSNDVDGYEWGIYRVKWTHGKAVEVWQTNADFSDLDAAIAKAERSADTPAGTPEPSKTGERL